MKNKTLKRGKSFMKWMAFVVSLILFFAANVHAEEPAREQCTMTIEAGKHTFEKPADADGACRGLVFGYYVPDSFHIIGSATYQVLYSGQQFEIPNPHYDYNPILTVYTIKKEPQPQEEKPEEPKGGSGSSGGSKSGSGGSSKSGTSTDSKSSIGSIPESGGNTESKPSIGSQSSSSTASASGAKTNTSTSNQGSAKESKPNDSSNEDKSSIIDVNEESNPSVDQSAEKDNALNADTDLSATDKTNTKNSPSLIIWILVTIVILTAVGIAVWFRKNKGD